MAYPLFWGSVRDTYTPGVCIASPFTPLQRVWMRPYWVSLRPQKETSVELVSSNGVGLADLKTRVNTGYSSLPLRAVRTYNPSFGLRMVIFGPNCVWWSSGIDWIVEYTIDYGLRSRLSHLRSKQCLDIGVSLLWDWNVCNEGDNRCDALGFKRRINAPYILRFIQRSRDDLSAKSGQIIRTLCLTVN